MLSFRAAKNKGVLPTASLPSMKQPYRIRVLTNCGLSLFAAQCSAVSFIPSYTCTIHLFSPISLRASSLSPHLTAYRKSYALGASYGRLGMYFPIHVYQSWSQYSNYLMCFMQANTLAFQSILFLCIGHRNTGIRGVLTLADAECFLMIGDIDA